ncbi:hypothetical protein [Orenia metallireducens]|uniref:hypothetical protein n=1 Tax=Orenia metallireducens TaxID=1413210 RepID=UPI001146588C|nr:hypothetical protein [Orenia metallireducens]
MVNLLDKLVSSTIKGLIYLLLVLFLFTSIYLVCHSFTTPKHSLNTIFNFNQLYRLNSFGSFTNINL